MSKTRIKAAELLISLARLSTGITGYLTDRVSRLIERLKPVGIWPKIEPLQEASAPIYMMYEDEMVISGEATEDPNDTHVWLINQATALKVTVDTVMYQQDQDAAPKKRIRVYSGIDMGS